MLSLGQVIAALIGVGRLLRWRDDGFDAFDKTARGFWASFWVALIILPVWCYVVTDQMVRVEQPSPESFFATQAIAYAIGWLAYPLAMVRICDFLGRWPRYYTYMVAYNWFQLVQAVAWAPMLLLMAFGAPRGLVAIVWLLTHGVLIAYAWFIARRGLQVDAGTASALVIIDLLLGVLIDRLAASLA
ncbi:hypothetical protein [Telmatospirillum siberiense]|uniref:YIP1 family protein n=1 Tax=Telmatospirillum siberiense TaxID=382514 RepID=A0A2N3Q0M9_9PROT|nr:hypothetical protein [Telmatospirillum siberiense]PKU26204.1 hypothetical protein CWS72_03530 [Telmatospirillum siberiense]